MSPFSKDYVSQLKPLPKQMPRPTKLNQPPKNPRASLKTEDEKRLEKMRKWSL